MRYGVALLGPATTVLGAATVPVNADPSLPPLGIPLDTYGLENTMYPGTSCPNDHHGVISSHSPEQVRAKASR